MMDASNKTERTFLWVSLLILGLLGIAISIVALSRGSQFRGVLYQPPAPAYDFSLRSGSKGNVYLHDFSGKVVLLFFGYTSCPDVCPTTLAELREVLSQLGEKADLVQVLYVTVDPQRDTAKRVQEYVEIFNPSFVGLSGDQDALQKTWSAYGVVREVQLASDSAVGYLISHSARLYLIDQHGNLFLSYPYGTLIEDIVHDIQELTK